MRKAVVLALALLMLVSLIPAVFAETELPKTHTFIFMSEGQEYLTVILKGEEKLERPTNPTSENGTFDGWYADEELTEPFENFGVNPEMDDGVKSTFQIICRFRLGWDLISSNPAESY
ncbi:MAG: InlB B-repeat-containing protein [Oscillospiraceae bacterium]|nr:InlB B-repeat-containing protein [Oscillospiraceae bacterium]